MVYRKSEDDGETFRRQKFPGLLGDESMHPLREMLRMSARLPAS